MRFPFFRASRRPSGPSPLPCQHLSDPPLTFLRWHPISERIIFFSPGRTPHLFEIPFPSLRVFFPHSVRSWLDLRSSHCARVFSSARLQLCALFSERRNSSNRHGTERIHLGAVRASCPRSTALLLAPPFGSSPDLLGDFPLLRGLFPARVCETRPRTHSLNCVSHIWLIPPEPSIRTSGLHTFANLRLFFGPTGIKAVDPPALCSCCKSLSMCRPFRESI